MKIQGQNIIPAQSPRAAQPLTPSQSRQAGIAFNRMPENDARNTKGLEEESPQTIEQVDASISRLSDTLSMSLQFRNNSSGDSSIVRNSNTTQSINALVARINKLVELYNRLNSSGSNPDSNPVSEANQREVHQEIVSGITELMMSQMYDMNERMVEDLKNPFDYTLSEVK